MKKKIFWQNQGHPVDEVYIDEINRVYIESGNLFVVAGAITGTETESEIIKSERIRLIVPLNSAFKFLADLNQAFSVLTAKEHLDDGLPKFVEIADEEEVQQETLGKPFTIGP